MDLILAMQQASSLQIGNILKPILALALLGVIVWLIVTYLPMPEPFKKVIIVLAAVVAIIWLAQQLGLW